MFPKLFQNRTVGFYGIVEAQKEFSALVFWLPKKLLYQIIQFRVFKIDWSGSGADNAGGFMDKLQ